MASYYQDIKQKEVDMFGQLLGVCSSGLWFLVLFGRDCDSYRRGSRRDEMGKFSALIFFQASSFQLLKLEIYCDDHSSPSLKY